jgi:hypothetical protein
MALGVVGGFAAARAAPDVLHLDAASGAAKNEVAIDSAEIKDHTVQLRDIKLNQFASFFLTRRTGDDRYLGRNGLYAAFVKELKVNDRLVKLLTNRGVATEAAFKFEIELLKKAVTDTYLSKIDAAGAYLSKVEAAGIYAHKDTWTLKYRSGGGQPVTSGTGQVLTDRINVPVTPGTAPQPTPFLEDPGYHRIDVVFNGKDVTLTLANTSARPLFYSVLDSGFIGDQGNTTRQGMIEPGKTASIARYAEGQGHASLTVTFDAVDRSPLRVVTADISMLPDPKAGADLVGRAIIGSA